MNKNTIDVYRVDRKMQKKHGLEQVRTSLLKGSEQLDPEIQKRYKTEIDRIIGNRYDAFQGKYESDFENEKDNILKLVSDELLDSTGSINDEITAEVLKRKSRTGGRKNTEKIKHEKQYEKAAELKKEINSFFSHMQYENEERMKKITDAKNPIIPLIDEAVSETLYEYTAAKVKLGQQTDELLIEENPEFNLVNLNVFNKFFINYEKLYKQIVEHKKTELDEKTKELDFSIKKNVDTEWELQQSRFEEITLTSLKLHVLTIIKTKITEVYQARREQIPGLLRIPSEPVLDLENMPTKKIEIAPVPSRKKISDIFKSWFNQRN